MKPSVTRVTRLTSLAILIGTSFQSFSQNIEAEDDSLEHVEVTSLRQAYRGNVPLKSLPQAVTVLSDETLDSFGVTDLQTALSLSGSVASQNNFGGLWDSFAVRGFAGDENSPSGYLVNGFNVGRGFSGRRDASNIEAIEILKGPGSALYGRGEPGGTINIITKKPEFDQEGYIEATAGSYDLYRLEGDYTNAVTSDLAFRVNGAYEDAGSFRDTVESNKLIFTPSVLYRLNDTTNLVYELEIIDQQAPFDRGIVVVGDNFTGVPRETFYGEPADGDMNIEAVGHQLSLQTSLNENWDVNAGLSYRDSSFEGYSTEVELSSGRQLLSEDNPVVSRQRRYRDYDTKDLSARAELSGRVQTGEMTHHILIGVDAYDYTFEQEMQRWRTAWGAGDTTYSVSKINPEYGQVQPEVAPLTDREENQSAQGIYIQDQVDLSEQFKLLVGFRFDDFSQDIENFMNGSVTSQDRTATSPRVGFVFEANSNFTFYTSYSEGFRPNSGADVDGNSFEPEESESYELGVKFSTEGDGITGTLALFNAEKSNILASDPVNSGFTAALGEAESKGLELDVKAYISEQTSLSLSYAYTDAATSNTVTNSDWGVEIPAGTRLLNIPENRFVLTAQREFTVSGKAAAVLGSFQYVGERPGELINQSYVLPSYTLVSIAGHVDINESLQVKVFVDNLLDEVYFDNSYSALWTQPGTPRTVNVSARYQF